MPLTNYAQATFAKNFAGSVATSTPATWYVALSSTTPTQVSTSNWSFTEPTSTGGYARLSVTNNTTNWTSIGSEPSNGYEMQNNVIISWSASTAAWSTGSTALTYVGLWDATTGGNLWGYGALSPTVTVNASGVTVSFAVGAITILLN